MAQMKLYKKIPLDAPSGHPFHALLEIPSSIFSPKNGRNLHLDFCSYDFPDLPKLCNVPLSVHQHNMLCYIFPMILIFLHRTVYGFKTSIACCALRFAGAALVAIFARRGTGRLRATSGPQDRRKFM